MAKLYSKNVWVDEVLADDERYDISEDDGTPIYADAQIALATAVTQAGTAVDADKMNNIEDGVDAIDDRLDDVDGRVEDIEDGWLDYSATSTITGWSSYTVKEIFYKVVGKIVFINFALAGTSNSATATFTLPYTSINMSILVAIAAKDNGSIINNAVAAVNPGSNLAGFYTNMDAAAWTASGTKTVVGQFFYEIA